MTGGELKHAWQGAYNHELPGGARFTSALSTLLNTPHLLEETAVSGSDPGADVGGTTAFRVPIGGGDTVDIAFHDMRLSVVRFNVGGESDLAYISYEEMDPALPPGFYTPGAPPPTQDEIDAYRGCQIAPY